MTAVAWAHLPDYLGQHVLLSMSAIAIGFALSLPLAIAISRIAWLRGPALGLASIVQTVPGLALLALFYPLLLALSTSTERVFGFGFRALGFLPAIARADALFDAPGPAQHGDGAGEHRSRAHHGRARRRYVREGQVLTSMVELLLAAPIIMAGIRTATVWVIGTATLSTPVGQTSLGNYIFTGLQTQNWVFVLGCAAAAALALVVDRLLACWRKTALRQLALAADRVGGGTACRAWSQRAAVARRRVEARGHRHQELRGAIHPGRAGMSTCWRKPGSRPSIATGWADHVVFHALEANDVDAYVDYSGTLWTTQMKRSDMPPRKVVLDQLSAWLAKRGVRAMGGRSASRMPMRSRCAATARKRWAWRRWPTSHRTRRGSRSAAISRSSTAPNGTGWRKFMACISPCSASTRRTSCTARGSTATST